LWTGLSEHIHGYLTDITLADLLVQRQQRQRSIETGECVVTIQKIQKQA